MFEENSVHDRTNDNVIVQLMKAADSDLLPFELTFVDNSTTMIDHEDARWMLATLNRMKTTARCDIMVKMQESSQQFMAEMVNLSKLTKH